MCSFYFTQDRPALKGRRICFLKLFEKDWQQALLALKRQAPKCQISIRSIDFNYQRAYCRWNWMLNVYHIYLVSMVLKTEDSSLEILMTRNKRQEQRPWETVESDVPERQFLAAPSCMNPSLGMSDKVCKCGIKKETNPVLLLWMKMVKAECIF